MKAVNLADDIYESKFHVDFSFCSHGQLQIAWSDNLSLENQGWSQIFTKQIRRIDQMSFFFLLR